MNGCLEVASDILEQEESVILGTLPTNVFARDIQDIVAGDVCIGVRNGCQRI